jgi:hypothetical protein
MNPGSRDFALDPQDLARLLVSRANAGDVEGMVALYEPDAALACGDGGLQLAQTLFASSILICWRLGQHFSGLRCFVRTWRSRQRAFQMVS